MLDADDDALDDIGFLDFAVGDGFLDGAEDYVADGRDLAAGSAILTEDADRAGAGVVGDHEIGFVLNHYSASFSPSATSAMPS